MILALTGPMGSGKTTAAVYWALHDLKEINRPILSNVQLIGCEYTRFDLEYFLGHLKEDIHNLTLIMDEAQQLMDSRSTATKLNKVFSYFLMQTRKLGVNLIVSTHYMDHVDLRLRRAADVIGSCYYRETPCRPCKTQGTLKEELCPHCLGYGKVGVVSVSLKDRRKSFRRSRTHLTFFANEIWPYFDTYQTIPLSKDQVSVGESALEVV